MTASELLKLAIALSVQVANGKKTIDQIRAVYRRKSPGTLETFDAAVTRAETSWAEADEMAARIPVTSPDGAGSTIDP